MKRSSLLLVLALLAVALPAAASRVRRLTLNELRDRAGAIIVGEVVGSSTRVGKANMVWTDYQVRVIETMKGDNQPAIKTISFAGGTSGSLSVGVDGVPELLAGRSYVFFLQADPRLLPSPTLGWGQGIFRFDSMESGGASRQLLVSSDGEPLELNGSGALVRGRLLQVRDDSVQEMKVSTQNRVSPSGMMRSDGSIQPLAPRAASAMVQPVRHFATLDQLRRFVAGDLASGEPEHRSKK